MLKNFKDGKYGVKEGSTWQQDVLDYFGFEGKYDPNDKAFQVSPNANAITRTQNGEIVFNESAFEGSYDKLAFIADHELQHSKNVLSGKYENVKINREIAEKEEWSVYMHNYKNQGLYPNHGIDYIHRINTYGYQGLIYEYSITPIKITTNEFKKKWWHFIYKIPRRF